MIYKEKTFHQFLNISIICIYIELKHDITEYDTVVICFTYIGYGII